MYAQGENFSSYSAEINGLLESTYDAKKRDVAWNDDNNVKYTVNFVNMVMTKSNSRTETTVKRSIIGKYIYVRI